MSYNIQIVRNAISSEDNKAWDELEGLFELENESTGQSNNFLDLIEKLTAKFPCITTLSDEDTDKGVWSDGPLKHNAGNNLTTLGITYPNVNTVIPFLIKTANANGFVVFDSQTGKISRPLKISLKPENKKSTSNIENYASKSYWSKLFKK